MIVKSATVYSAMVITITQSLLAGAVTNAPHEALPAPVSLNPRLGLFANVGAYSSPRATYANAPTSNVYSAAPTSNVYSAAPTSNVYSAAPTSHVYSAAPTSHVYSAAPTSHVYYAASPPPETQTVFVHKYCTVTKKATVTRTRCITQYDTVVKFCPTTIINPIYRTCYQTFVQTNVITVERPVTEVVPTPVPVTQTSYQTVTMVHPITVTTPVTEYDTIVQVVTVNHTATATKPILCVQNVCTGCCPPPPPPPPPVYGASQPAVLLNEAIIDDLPAKREESMQKQAA